jgi:pyrimidine deaminase RibD-like protein
MRAKDFIRESRPAGKMNDNLRQSHQGSFRMRDIGGYDRTYHLNRIWMATAMADGRSRKPVDMDSASFVEKYNVAFPYTDIEHMMVLQAMATIPTDGCELEKRSKSEELKDTNTVSPVSNWNTDNKKTIKETKLARPNRNDYEIHSLERLDKIMTDICRVVIEHQHKDSEYYGMVGACLIDPDDNRIFGVNYLKKDGLRAHAERAAMENYVKKYGTIPEGCIMLTTLSPCNEYGTHSLEDRYGKSCTDLINNSPIKKVYCGYIDPSQGEGDYDERMFSLMETRNADIRNLCKQFADTFLKNDHKH